MRFHIFGDKHDEEVIGEPFAIAGTTDQFAVHATILADSWSSPWTATHVESGFFIARGDTIDGAIAAARVRWSAAPPEKIAEAKAKAAEARAAREKIGADQ